MIGGYRRAPGPGGPLRVTGWVAGCLLLALALGTAPPAAGQEGFADAYKAGLAAAESGDWAAVASQMRAAIAARPEADARVLRLGFGRYVPHYYLGLALAELGDCPGALDAWKESERQGIIQRLDEHSRLVEGRQRCEALLASRQQARQAVAAAEQALVGAESTLQEVLELSQGPELTSAWGQGTPSPALRLGTARDQLEKAREENAAARSSAGSAPEAATATARRLQALAGEIEAEGQALLAIIEELSASARQRRDTQLQGLAPLLAEARTLLSEISYLAPYPPAIGRLRSRLQALISSAEAQRSGAAGSPGQIAQLRSNLTDTLGELRTATVAPPAILRAVTEAFLRGDHQEVVDLLAEETDLPGGRARPHALLLRAAARYSLYLRAGEGDAEALEGVREDIRACARMAPNLTPIPRVFSPRFVELFSAETAPEEPLTEADPASGNAGAAAEASP